MIGEGKTRGQAAILDIPACNNQNCAAVRVSEAGYPPQYVYWYLYAVYEQTRRAGGGNNQPALNKDRVQRLLFPLAPPEEASAIVQAIDARLQPIQRISDDLDKGQELLTRLDAESLKKAFRGELVPQDPSDEPAAALLERLRHTRPAVRGRRMRSSSRA